MCLKPIHIVNRSRSFVRGFSSPELVVPCGHCSECRKAQQGDWFVRAYYEYERCKDKGANWFLTLTYNDENLPYWHDSDRNFTTPCFNPDHFKSFRSKLRVYLKREGYDCAGLNTIRYIYCCEYGGKRGRPHIHCSLYVPFHVPASVMHRLINKAWIYGFAMYSKKGMIAQSVRASRYVMKYISKDMSWYKCNRVTEYENDLRHEISMEKDSEYKQLLKQKLKDFRRCCPRHFQSMGFGIDGVGHMTDSNLLNDSISSCDLGVRDGKQWSYRVPQYYKRKLMYDCVDGCYFLNDYGKSILSQRFDTVVRNNMNKFLPYFQDVRLHLSSVVRPEKLDSVVGSLSDLVSGLNLKTLSVYELIYRGKALDFDNIGYLNSCKSENVINMLTSHAQVFYDSLIDFDYSEYLQPKEYPDGSKFDYRGNALRVPGYSDLACFADYESFLNEFYRYEYRLGSAHDESCIAESLRIQELEHNLKDNCTDKPFDAYF